MKLFILGGFNVIVHFERGGARDPTVLMRLINPVPLLNRVQFHSSNFRFTTGIVTGDRMALNDYVAWGRRYVTHSPASAVHVNMVLALHELGRREEAGAMLQDLHRLYPSNEWKAQVPLGIAARLESIDRSQ